MAIDLQTVDEETGEPPESRIKDYAAATRLYRTLRDADQIPARNRDLVHRLMRGDPPRDQKLMDDAGMGSFCNVNFLKAAADRDQAVTVFNGLSDSPTTLINVKTKYGDPAQRGDWEAAIDEEYTWLMRERWESYYDRKQALAVALVSDGLGLAYYPHAVDWRSEVGRPGQFLFPTDAKTDVAKWDLVIQVEHVQATTLYQKLKKYEEVVAKGDESTLNKEATLKAIQDACKISQNDYIGKDVYDRFRDNDLCATYAQSQEIVLVHYYVKEYSGKVSHYVGRADGIGDDFLEVDRNAFESMNQCFIPYADGVGEGEIASLQGIIWRAYPSYQIDNEIRCDAHNLVKLASIMFLQAGQGAKPREALAQLSLESVTVLPPDVSVVANEVSAAALSAMMPLLSENAALLANNTGGYASHDVSPEDGGGSGSRTAREVSLQAANSAQIGGAKIINYYRSESAWNRETFRRLQNEDYNSRDPGWRERNDMLERLQARGVPLQAFFGVYEVKTVRAIGLGSPAAQGAAFDVLQSKRPFMDPVGQRNLDRDMAAAAGTDYGTLNRYLPPLDVKRTTPDEEIAPLEHGAFAAGLLPPVYEIQDPYIHIPIHLGFVDQTNQMLQSGIIDAKQAVKQLGPTLEQLEQHFQAAQDPQREDEVKAWQKAYAAAGKNFTQLKGYVQQAAQQQPAPVAPDPKEAIGDLNALANLAKAGVPITHDQISAALVKSGLPPFPDGAGVVPTPQGPVSQPAVAATVADQATAAKAQAEIQRNNAVAQAEIERKNALLQQQLAHANLKTQATIAHSAIQAGANSVAAPETPEVQPPIIPQ